MAEGEDIRRFSLEALKAWREVTPGETRSDAPVYPLDEEFWRNARVVMPARSKASVHLRMDADVLDWFRAQGKGHLTRMNAVLRSFVDAHRPR